MLHGHRLLELCVMISRYESILSIRRRVRLKSSIPDLEIAIPLIPVYAALAAGTRGHRFGFAAKPLLTGDVIYQLAVRRCRGYFH